MHDVFSSANNEQIDESEKEEKNLFYKHRLYRINH
jgi:hypothetical protein